MSLYLYTLQYRPPGIGTCPKGWELVERPRMPGWERRTDLPESKHRFGVIGYERPLSAEDVERYELTPLGQAPFALNPRGRGPLLVIWRKVYAYARRKSKLVPRLSLNVGCSMVAGHRQRDTRAFMHTNHKPRVVCSSPTAATLELKYVVGLFFHEIGHEVATRAYGVSEQWDADSSCLQFLGIRIRYGGPLLLEYVSDRDLKKVMREGR